MLLWRPTLRLNTSWQACLCVLLAVSGPSPARSNDTAAETAIGPLAGEPSDQVAGLIRELGAGEYASRERAQAKLRRLGLDVFDQLYDAQASDDIEIALRARYLLRSLTVRWSHDDDPLQVKELLRAYDDKSEDERRNLIEQLAKLPENQGIKAVCRIVRFETSNVLSKRAALLTMQRKTDPGTGAVAAVSDAIMGTLGTSKREAANWLRVYVSTLKDPTGTLPEWERIWPERNRRFTTRPTGRPRTSFATCCGGERTCWSGWAMRKRASPLF